MTDRYASFRHLKFDRPAERVLRITLDRPERLNSLDWEAHGELTKVWLLADEDPEVNAIIICGAGKAFSAGGDFSMVERIANDYSMQVAALREFRDLCYNMINCSKPIISAIHGPAVGAGLAVALLADISIRELVRRTGLSLAYCRQIKRGLVVPHPMWWEAIRSLAGPRGGVA